MARHEMYSKTFEREKETKRGAKRSILGIIILGVLWRKVERDGLLIGSLVRLWELSVDFCFWEGSS